MQRPAEAPARPVASAAEGETLIKHLLEVMEALLGTVEEETALVRAGKLAEAAKLEPPRPSCRGMYIADTARIKASQVYLDRGHAGDGRGTAPAPRPVPRGAANESDCARDRPRGFGKHHARRLGELARKATPQAYGASGRATAPAAGAMQPLTLSRVL